MDSRRNFLRGMARAATPGQPAEAPRRQSHPAPEADPAPTAPDRYAVPRAVPEWGAARQGLIGQAEVLVIGAGALAGPVLTYLAGAGVGRLGVVDNAVVAPDDLRADALHFTPDAGVAKAHSAAVKLGFLNPDIVVEPYQVHLDDGNAEGLLSGQHMVVDCSNSERTNAIVADAGHALGVDVVIAFAGSRRGWVLSVGSGLRACPDCVRAESPREGSWLPGPLAGILGSIAAGEALARIGTAPDEVASGKLVRVDASGPDVDAVPWRPRRDCPHGGDR